MLALGIPWCWGASTYLTTLCSYHTGSLAFGALILTLVQIARVILEYIDHKLRGKRVVGCVARALEGQADRQKPEAGSRWLNVSFVCPQGPRILWPDASSAASSVASGV